MSMKKLLAADKYENYMYNIYVNFVLFTIDRVKHKMKIDTCLIIVNPQFLKPFSLAPGGLR